MNLLVEQTELTSLLQNSSGNIFVWQRFLEQVAVRLNCDSSALLVTDLAQPENTRFLFTASISKEHQERYETELNNLDAFNHFISNNPLEVFCNQNLKDSHGNKIEGDFIQAKEQDFRFGLSIPFNDSHSFSLLVSRKRMFNDLELHQFTKYLKSIMPSLETAIYEEQRLKINSQLFNYTCVPFEGYIVIDRDLNILFSNPEYPLFTCQLDCLNISENLLGIKNPEIGKLLASMLENSDQNISTHDSCHACQITLIRMSSLENLYPWECHKDGFIFMFSHDHKQNPIIDRLEDIFRLSRCEAVCAFNFMNTPSIGDIAASTYRSKETIRNHIKRVMQKMGVHSQAELMKKLVMLSAL